jgi:hypothetical protein
MGIKMANPLLIRDLKLYFRIMEHVNKYGSVRTDMNPCWIWTRKGSTTKHGYGVLSIDGETFNVHVLMYILCKDKYHQQNTKTVRHKCDNPGCCNPRHLETGSQIDNVKDMWVRCRALPQGKKPLTLEQYEIIIDEHKKGELIINLAKKYNRDRTIISKIVNGYYEPYLKQKAKNELISTPI